MLGPALLVGCLALLALAATAIAGPARQRSGQRAPDTKITSVKIRGEGTARFAFKGIGRAPLKFECALDKARFSGCRSPKSYRKLAAGPHRFRVRAVAADGSKDPSPAKARFSIHGGPRDTTPPTATIDSGPSGLIVSGQPAYAFHADEPSTFECSVVREPPAWFPCASPYKPSAPLPDGAYAFRVRARDAFGNVGAAAERDFTVDTQPPTVTIEDGPVGTVSTGSATFKFSSPDGGAGFVCRLDQDPAGFTPCASPKSYTGLLGVGGANGSVPHVFEVKAIDAAGNVGAPTVRNWSVDKEPPVVTITDGPANEKSTNDSSPKFEFTVNETAFLLCRIRLESTGGGKFEQCSSPKQYGTPSPLPDGFYVFEVRAIDTAGNEGAASGRKFQVDTIPPGVAIIAGPHGASSSHSPEFGFESPDQLASFECQLDTAAFAACGNIGSGGVKYTSVADGPHTFTVHAKDAAGNVSSESRAWTVDSTPPALVIDSGPADPTTETSASFAFHATDSSSVTFQCKLDGGGALVSCASPTEYTGLAPGPHTFEVRATDAAGNVATETYSWTIT